MPEEVRADLLLGRDTLTPGLLKAGQAASDASGNTRQLTRDLYELGKQRATPIVDLQDTAATAKLDEVSAKLKELGAQAADPQIDVKDKQAAASVAAIRVKLDDLGKKVSSPRITLEGLARAEAKLLALDAQLDKLDGRNVDVTVSVHQSLLSRLKGLLGGGGLGGVAGAGEGGGGLLSSVGIPGLVGGGLLAAGLIPGLVGAGLGGITGLGAIGGGLFGAAQGKKAAAADLANIKAITTQLKTAVGQQKKELSAALKDAQKQYQKDSAFYAPFTGLQAAISHLAQDFLKPLRPIMAPLTGIITEFGKGLAALGPQFTALFKASLPFVRQFLQFLLQSGKILLPAFTQALTEMVKSGALTEMTRGLVYLVQGLAGFIKALGPGMRASGQIFERLALAIKGAMIGLGVVISFIANLLEFNFAGAAKRGVHAVAGAFDAMRHAVADVFDAIRHDIAHAWDVAFENTIGAVIRFGHNVASAFDAIRHGVASVFHDIAHAFDQFRHFQGQAGAFQKDIAWIWDHIRRYTAETWDFIRHYIASRLDDIRHGIASAFDAIRHGIASAFDAIRHGIASAWDAIWRNTRTSVTSGIADVVGWFRALPGKVIHALFGLGHQLYAFAHAALNEMWSGFKAVAGSILSWVGNFVENIWKKVKKFFGIHSPSSLFYDIGKNLMLGLFHGIKDHAHRAAHAASAVGGRVSGALGGDAAANAALARRMMPAWASGPEWAAWNYVAMRESGWNQFAYNPSGAFGIPQALPYTKMPHAAWPTWAGGQANPMAQIGWMIGYIRSTYGDPIGAAAWERSHNWYGSGLDAMISRPTLIGVGERGPEHVQVTPVSSPSRGAGATVINNVNVQVGHGTHPVAAAQEIVKLLNQGAKAGVRVRSSILGPG